MRSRHRLEGLNCIKKKEEIELSMTAFRESRNKNGSQWKDSKKTLCKNTNKYQKKILLN